MDSFRIANTGLPAVALASSQGFIAPEFQNEGAPLISDACCVISASALQGLRAADPEAYAAQLTSTRAIHQLRGSPQLRYQFANDLTSQLPYTFRLSQHVPRRIKDRVHSTLGNVAPLRSVDAGSSPTLQRVLLDAGRQGDISDKSKVKVLRVEGQAPTGDKDLDTLWVNAGVTVKLANELIDRVRVEIAKLYPEIPVDKLPFNNLLGQYPLVTNYIEKGSGKYGWANLAAVPVPGAVGIMLLGALTAYEAPFFIDPIKAVEPQKHEVGHLVHHGLYPQLGDAGEVSPLKEAFGDCFAKWSMNRQFNHGALIQNTREAWGMGADFLVQQHDGFIDYLRHFYETAHRDDHKVLGTDMADHHWPLKRDCDLPRRYREIRAMDPGGHLDAAAKNFIFYKTAQAFGGDVDKALMIFAMALAISNVANDYALVMDELAHHEVLAAKRLYGDEAAQVVKDIWKTELGFDTPAMGEMQRPEAKLPAETPGDESAAHGRRASLRGLLARGAAIAMSIK